MSIQTNFPAIKPSLLLDFSNTKQLDSRITFTRASTATYYGTQTAKAEENLLLQSQDFATTWAPSNLTVAANTTTAPDGTTTADTLTDNTNTGAHIINQSPVLLTSTIYTMSVFLKANTHNFATVTLTNPTTVENGITAVVDLSVGTISETDTGTSATFTSSSITSVGSGWYRVVITGSSVASFSRAEVGFATAATGNTFASNQRISFTGTGTASFYVWGAQLEQRSAVTAYTPTTTQAITNYVPQILTAASGVARFDHNPTTFESLGLEIEESRTNLVTYSEQFDDAAWTKTNSSITANTVVAPDGALTGDKIVSNAASLGFTVQNNSQTSGVTYTWSTFAKAAEYSFCQLRIAGTVVASITRAYFNLATGTVSGVANCTASITPVGNGWYRCSIVYAVTSTAVAAPRIYGQVDASDTVGDGYSGIYIWGAQLEAGAFATSYIPTVASQVTRAADAASMTGTNFSSWYNAGQGTLYAEANTPSFATTYVFADINSNSTTTYIRHSTASTGTNTQFVISDNSVTTASPGVIVTLGSYRKMAGAYTADSVQQSVNGSLGTEDTSATIPSGLSQMNIGTRSSGANTVNGTIRKLAYYPLRVTNAQLQALTS